MTTRTTVWQNTSWVWRTASLVGLVTGLGVVWWASFGNFYSPREDNFRAAASANIVLLWAVPVALLLWGELVWRGRTAWLWIAVWTGPVHAGLLWLLTVGWVHGVAWLAAPQLAGVPLDPWLSAFVWANMGLQVWVGLRAMRLGRALRASLLQGREADDTDESARARHTARRASDVLTWALAVFVLYCLWFPGSVVPVLLTICGREYP